MVIATGLEVNRKGGGAGGLGGGEHHSVRQVPDILSFIRLVNSSKGQKDTSFYLQGSS